MAVVRFQNVEVWEAPVTNEANAIDGDTLTAAVSAGTVNQSESIRLWNPEAVGGSIGGIDAYAALKFTAPAGRTTQLATLYYRYGGGAWTELWQGNPETLTVPNVPVPLTGSLPDLELLVENYYQGSGGGSPPTPPDIKA